MREFILIISIFIFNLLLAAPVPEIIYKGNGVIWSFDFISKDELIFTRRNGELYLFNLSKKKTKRVELNLPIEVIGQGGLLDVVYKKPHIYLTYTKAIKNGKTTALAKAELVNEKLINLKEIFSAKVESNTPYHFGSRLLILENSIFMTIGDRGKRDLAQNLNYHQGKILRLNLDGSAFHGNPYFGKKEGLDEIWTFGHRNPQGITYDSMANTIYSSEFGPRGGDELNIIERGKNYGWPVITYGREYSGSMIGDTHKVGMEQPIVYWVPSISPSGIHFYKGNKYKKLSGSILMANLSSRHLRVLTIKNKKVIQEVQYYEKLNERIRHVRSGIDEFLYFSTDNGKIYKMIPEK